MTTTMANGRGGSSPRAARVGSLSSRDRGEVVDLVREAARLCEATEVITPAGVKDHHTARRALSDAWSQVLTATGTAVGKPERASRAGALLDLLRRIKDLDDALLRRDVENRDAVLHRVRDSLNALSDIDTTTGLIARVPSAVCALGFDRAIISRVDEATWVTENVAVERDPTWAGQILEVARQAPLPLTGTLPEVEIVRRRVSLVVENVQYRDSVHKPIADVSLSRSYAASPIIAGGEVVGFLHADCYYQQRDLDETDRQVLATFAEGLSQVLARTTVLDQLGAVRTSLTEMASRLGSPDPASGGWGTLAAAPAPSVPREQPAGEGPYGRTSSRTASSTFASAELTRRELEVLKHLAAGDTNARTARRLVISEGTVKSHVKHILRKLGAANRAEAVSLWWRMENERRGNVMA